MPEDEFVTRSLVCTLCWERSRVLVRKARTDTDADEPYPKCERCGKTTDWIDLPITTTSQGVQDGTEEMNRRHPMPGVQHPSNFATPEERRRADRMFERDEDAPERQPWWYDEGTT